MSAMLHLFLITVIFTDICILPTVTQTEEKQSDDTPFLYKLRNFILENGKSIDFVTEIAAQDYIKFGQLLVNDNEVRIADRAERGDPKNIVIHIFRKWLSGEGKPVMWSTLEEYLRASNMDDLADCIHNRKCTFKDLNGITTNRQQLEYAKLLKGKYNKQKVTDPDQWLQFPMPFINLTLTEEGKITRQLVEGSIESSMHGQKLNLDEIISNITSGNRILTVGRPGAGKSTLLRHIAKQWAEGQLLEKFSLVVFVQLGRILEYSKITNLESLLKYLAPDYPQTSLVAGELGRTGGENICFLLDALDEYSGQDDDYMYQLLKGEVLPSAAVIVTSRPAASYRLHKYFDRKIEVVGFLEHQVQQYINTLPASISEYLHNHTNVKYISYLPLHLAMLTYLAFHSEGISLMDLGTDTMIYHMFVNLTFRQRYSKDEDNLDEIHNQAFYGISKAAFNSIVCVGYNGFHSKSCSIRLRELDHKLKQTIESYSILTINRQHDGHSITYLLTFSHYTFQEFFAAYYLTTLPYEEQIENLERHHYLKYYRFIHVWKFFFGLLSSQNSENTKKVFQKFAQINDATSIILMCAYELKQPAIAESLASLLNHSITIDYIPFPSDCAIIGYAISLNPYQFKNLIMAKASFSCEEWEACLASMVAKLPKQNGVVHLTLGELTLCNRTASAVIETLRHFPNLQQLKIAVMSQAMDYSAVKFPMTRTVAMKLEDLIYLKHLEIKVNGLITRVGEAFKDLIIKCLKTLIHLEHFALHTWRVGIESAAILLKHLTNLQHLDLSGTNVALEDLKNAIKHQELYLQKNELGNDTVVTVAEGLKHAVKLQYLDLSNNEFGNDEALAIAEGLKNALNLKYLDLSHNNIEEIGITSLASTLQRCTHLQYLDLSYNRIRAAEALNYLLKPDIEAISTVRTPRHLYYPAQASGCHKLPWKQVLLFQCNLDIDKIAYFPNKIQLEYLDLSRNSLGNEGATKLAQSLKHFTLLQTLTLSLNAIGDDGIIALAEGIKHSSSLHVLDLSWNAIEGRGATKLAEKILHLSSLERLDLGRNKVGEAGAAQLAQLSGSMKQLVSLQILELNKNKIDDDGVIALAEGIRHLTSLRKLDLSWNAIGERGAAKLAEAAKDLSSLEELDLSNNNIGDRGAALLAKETKHLSSLKIHLRNNNIK